MIQNNEAFKISYCKNTNINYATNKTFKILIITITL